MKKHIANFLKATDKLPHEIMCEVCGKLAMDIHHIEHGRFKRSDEFSNLIGLCRSCHDRAHFKKEPYLTKEELYEQIQR